MKKIIVVLSIILSAGILNTANAQINVNVNINSQPAWGPTGYDCADFYYFPDLNIYFDINNSLFYYPSGSKWTSNRYLPQKYSQYDLYGMYKVVINNHSQPWLQNKTHKKEYSSYKGNKTQISIRNSNDSRYNQSKNNTVVWVDNNKQSTGNKNKNSNRKESNSNRNNNNSKSTDNRQASNNTGRTQSDRTRN